MNSHELAIKLLSMPDLPIVREVEETETTLGYNQRLVDVEIIGVNTIEIIWG